jgi:protein gp37
MQREWVCNIRDQCQRAGVQFFFKQWGGVRKSETGRRPTAKLTTNFPS